MKVLSTPQSSVLEAAAPATLAGPAAFSGHKEGADNGASRNPFLLALGERVRALRYRRGITRKALAAATRVSQRHLANLEYGKGNASILVLHEVAQALECPLAELIGDVTTSSPEWLMLREVLCRLDESALRRVRVTVPRLVGVAGQESEGTAVRSSCIALIGLRGAGKTTLGQMLAEDLGFPFVELSRLIEQFAGCSVAEIHALYGVNAYRRYERRALDEAIQRHPKAVITTPGGLVSDPSTFNALLSHCTTVWLQADPEDHMRRVTAQGDLRPMASSKESMDDLRGILAGRAAFYSKADMTLNTSLHPLSETFQALRHMVRTALFDQG